MNIATEASESVQLSPRQAPHLDTARVQAVEDSQCPCVRRLSQSDTVGPRPCLE